MRRGRQHKIVTVTVNVKLVLLLFLSVYLELIHTRQDLIMLLSKLLGLTLLMLYLWLFRFLGAQCWGHILLLLILVPQGRITDQLVVVCSITILPYRHQVRLI